MDGLRKLAVGYKVRRNHWLGAIRLSLLLTLACFFFSLFAELHLCSLFYMCSHLGLWGHATINSIICVQEMSESDNVGCNVKHRKTSLLLIIQLATEMLYFVWKVSFVLVANICWRQCREHIDAKDVEKSPLQLKVFGIATRRHMNCSHGSSASLRPDVMPDVQEKVEKLTDGKTL